MTQTDEITSARLRELADNAFDTEFRVLQTALRAAADTLAAREALLRRAGQWLAGDAMVFAALAESVLREAPACDERAKICRALAAEIAAALGKETDQ